MNRILTLTSYLLRSLFTSLAGVIYLILTLAFWFILFNPQQRTPEASYYILVIGLFGAGLVFLITLTNASRANKVELAPWLVRLPSRIEYLTAVFLSSIIAAGILQLLLALLSLISGPTLTFSQILGIPPVWLSTMVVTAVLALHATDLVTYGWSRVYVFGILAVLLFGRSITNQSVSGFASNLSEMALNQGWYEMSESLRNFAVAQQGSDTNIISQLMGFVFWPFQALADGISGGGFTAVEALAPAILLLYAAILFVLAADFFAAKDMQMTE
ncbi:MAG: hypothetical protein HF973_02835 [Chloroflexi bacterium]|nr:hypothetical protein [Chloroflexota bacterium]